MPANLRQTHQHIIEPAAYCLEGAFTNHPWGMGGRAGGRIPSVHILVARAGTTLSLTNEDPIACLKDNWVEHLRSDVMIKGGLIQYVKVAANGNRWP